MNPRQLIMGLAAITVILATTHNCGRNRHERSIVPKWKNATDWQKQERDIKSMEEKIRRDLEEARKKRGGI